MTGLEPNACVYINNSKFCFNLFKFFFKALMKKIDPPNCFHALKPCTFSISWKESQLSCVQKGVTLKLSKFSNKAFRSVRLSFLVLILNFDYVVCRSKRAI